jgi:hypothetical protein
MSVSVDHNYPHTDDMTVLDPNGDPIENVVVRAFTLAAYAADVRDTWLAETTTDVNGKWVTPFLLDESQTYIVHFEKTTMFGPITVEVTT